MDREEWIDERQADQLDEQSLDFPLSYAALNSCTHVPPSEAEDYSDTLQPSSIAVYADMGHLTTYCTSSHSTLQAVMRFRLLAAIVYSIRASSSSMDLPSLDKMLRVFNTNLVVVQSNERDDGLVDQARSIAQSIQQIEGYENPWKLIAIAATIQDGPQLTWVRLLSLLRKRFVHLAHGSVELIVHEKG
ncbi:hypothetical protein ANCCEY_10718 [Ancylostoma ceylanicum]|uniref:Uncharacterized protein n=1 Tax=Ancylostoma ceylanicum TaxID=53326 RepID=A0A0D6LG73_9BILA|nr:hypothetical protein ANCCEY_10718 [Ancylostoma ceylanicum]